MILSYGNPRESRPRSVACAGKCGRVVARVGARCPECTETCQVRILPPPYRCREGCTRVVSRNHGRCRWCAQRAAAKTRKPARRPIKLEPPPKPAARLAVESTWIPRYDMTGRLLTEKHSKPAPISGQWTQRHPKRVTNRRDDE